MSQSVKKRTGTGKKTQQVSDTVIDIPVGDNNYNVKGTKGQLKKLMHSLLLTVNLSTNIGLHCPLSLPLHSMLGLQNWELLIKLF